MAEEAVNWKSTCFLFPAYSVRHNPSLPSQSNNQALNSFIMFLDLAETLIDLWQTINHNIYNILYPLFPVYISSDSILSNKKGFVLCN